MIFWRMIRTAFRSVMANKMRSFLAILGVIIGVGAIIAMISIGEGAEKEVSEALKRFGNNLLRVRPVSARVGHVRRGLMKSLKKADAHAIRESGLPVKQVVPSVRNIAQVKYANRNVSTMVIGTTPEYPYAVNFHVERGDFIGQRDIKLMRRVVVLGTTVKENLFGEGDPLGAYIKIKGVGFRVIGVMESKGQTAWFDPDDQIFVPLSTSQSRLFRQEHIDDIFIHVESLGHVSEVKGSVERLLRVRHRLSYGEESDFRIRDYTEYVEAVKSVSHTFKVLLGGIAAVSLLVGGIGVMNIMMVSVTERTREIGTRMAVGARRKDILYQFLIESLMITLIGGVTGIILGVLITCGIARFGEWETIITPSAVILAFLFSVTIGIIFGMYPARKAALMHPIEALRHE